MQCQQNRTGGSQHWQFYIVYHRVKGAQCLASSALDQNFAQSGRFLKGDFFWLKPLLIFLPIHALNSLSENLILGLKGRNMIAQAVRPGFEQAI